jgi:hypothetical protein
MGVGVGPGTGVGVAVGAGVGVGVLVVVQPATINATTRTDIVSANAISLDLFMNMTPSSRLIYFDLAFSQNYVVIGCALVFVVQGRQALHLQS